MAGIAFLVDLCRKNPSFCSPNSLHSSGFFSASTAAASAAASIAAGVPFASRFLFGCPKIPVAYCDVGAALSDADIFNMQRVSGDIFQHDALKYTTKEYKIELKPLFSAFELKAFSMTSLRSFLIFYLPLLEPATNTEEEDDDIFHDAQEERHVDLIVPFKKSLKQIVRETTVVTTRRILERLAVHYVSQRMAWKLLKGHLLGVAAAWIVQVGIEIYQFLKQTTNSEDEIDTVSKSEEAKLLRKKVSGVTIRCGASLIFASIGAGIGATLVRPSIGQWIGCAVGDLAGPIIVTFCLDRALHIDH
ncbi:hypothetical protein SLEP1_g51769 [Rubroshorea leprosula]|uniref:Isopentenyl-diphosphate delta-isomerase n=1 Tax=Rubroshorea leprosula TaxID=152421 RepID=A0AAV5M4B1_9ROSI|nr:hypothetical protein SLEP1_g51769 [Rubroshorea leprosula]